MSKLLISEKKHGNFFDVVFSSSAIRAMQTAREIVGRGKIIPLDILYVLPNPDENDELVKMGERHGYESLGVYLSLEPPDKNVFMHKLGEMGSVEIKKIAAGLHDKKFLVVAHAVTINILIYAMFKESIVATEAAFSTQLGECEALQISTGENGQVIDVSLLQ